jgi:4'-phosphopantetheinyl transferase
MGARAPEFDFLLSLLPPDEAAECRKFRFPDDQRRAVVSRLLQRSAAAAVLGLAPADVTIARTKGRKPYVSNPSRPLHAPNFNYSVSHEGDYVILAAEPICIAGCDVAAPQQLRRRPGQPLAEVLASLKDQLTVAEWDSVQALKADEVAMEAHFRKLWSLKEAFVKATGEGLGFPLAAAEFHLSGCGRTATVAVRGAPQPGWRFHVHELGGGHWASVARAPVAEVVDAWGVRLYIYLFFCLLLYVYPFFLFFFYACS